MRFVTVLCCMGFFLVSGSQIWCLYSCPCSSCLCPLKNLRKKVLTEQIVIISNTNQSIGPSELQKLQHGCIDCLGLIIRAAFPTLEETKHLLAEKTSIRVREDLISQSSITKAEDLLPLILQYICTGIHFACFC